MALIHLHATEGLFLMYSSLQGAAVLIRSLPLKSRKGLAHDVTIDTSATRAGLGHDVTDCQTPLSALRDVFSCFFKRRLFQFSSVQSLDRLSRREGDFRNDSGEILFQDF